MSTRRSLSPTPTESAVSATADIVVAASVDPGREESSATLRKVTRAAFAGTVVEWFDFAVYGFMATYIADAYFGNTDGVTGLLQTFAIFAVAFAFRPLGGVFFGRLGDRLGRKSILSATVLLMTGATAAIALIPTHATIGIWAPILLTIARCLQGFSAGGEYAGATIYVVEHSPAESRARWSSAMPAATFASFALAASLGALIGVIVGEDAMAAWGWRLLFLVAVPMGLVAFYIRRRLDESPEFVAMRNDQNEQPHTGLADTLRSQGGNMLRLGSFVMLTALSFYIFSTYMTTFLKVVVGMSGTAALVANLIALVAATAMAPIAGRVCDRVGRRRTMLFAAGTLAVLTVPSYALASTGVLAAAAVGQILMAVGAVTANVVTAVLLSEFFPTRVRYTSSAISYNVTYAVFGGTAPYVATWLISQTSNAYAPAVYVTVVAVLAGLATLFLIPETAGKPLAR